MQSTLLLTIIKDVRPSGLPDISNIASMSSEEKMELYEHQKLIIQKFRDQSHDHVRQLQEELKIAFDENKNLPLSTEYSTDSFGIPKISKQSQLAPLQQTDKEEKPAIVMPAKSSNAYISYHASVFGSKPNMKMNPKFGKRPYFHHY